LKGPIDTDYKIQNSELLTVEHHKILKLNG